MGSRPRSRRPARRWLANAGLVVASIVICLLAGEIGLRLTHDNVSLWRWPNFIAEATKPDPAALPEAVRYDPELGWEPRPGAVDEVYRRRIDFSFEIGRAHV